MATIAVLGVGYVGLTTSACFSRLGHQVIAADIDQVKIDALNRGECPIVEDGLADLLNEGIAKGKLAFITDNRRAISDAEFVFICLPTPQGKDGVADTTVVESVAEEISKFIKTNAVIVTKSTVPVGSTSVIEQKLQRSDVFVVSNPEFLREGSAVFDFMNPDRIVIGSQSESAAKRVADLYVGIDSKIVITDPASAETIKYAANAFLATKISYINAIAAVCEGVGADVLAVIDGIGSDKRIGRSFLQPGPGWGGSCFPKDSKALVKIAENAGYDFALLRGVIEVNEQQYLRIVEKIMTTQKDHLGEFRVTVLGLTFKAGTDDRRDSPALFVARLLQKRGAVVNAYDPTVKADNDSSDLTGIQLFDSAYDALTGSDVLAVLTEWEEIRGIEPVQVSNLMRSKVVVDARNVLNKETWQSNGFNYLGVGR
jgi:UDPglucose 6-dehydrogenase